MNKPKIKFKTKMAKVRYNFLRQILMEDKIKDGDNLTSLCFMIPEIYDIINFDQKNPNHHLDVLEHTIYAISLAPKNFDIRFALLLHDIGKPGTMVIDKKGIGHFPNHPALSAELAKNIIKNLDFSDDYNDYICKLVAQHDNIIKQKDESVKEIIDRDGKKFFKDLLEMQYADAKAHNPDKVGYRIVYLNKINEIFKKVSK